MSNQPMDGTLTRLDRISDGAANFLSRPPMLALVLLLALAWVVSHFVAPETTTHLLIDIFEMLTLLLVLLLQNSERRAEIAINRKLDRQAEALAVVVEGAGDSKLAAELRESVEIEERD